MTDIDFIASENRRLQKEVAQLSGRVRAFESSRWWRLHPRFLLRRAAGSIGLGTRRRVAQPPAGREAGGHAGVADSPTLRFREEMMSRGTFTDDWFTAKSENWEPILRELEGRSARILEIGSFEGLSACFLLWRLPDANLTCIDTFEGSPEQVAYGVSVSGLQDVFGRNVALVDSSRVRTLIGDSRRVLLDLGGEDTRYDLVYIDGSHLGLDVLIDASLSWRLLAPGGLVIFDDYTWAQRGDDALLRPGPAIDAFLRLVEGHSEIVFRQEQVAVRRLDE